MLIGIDHPQVSPVIELLDAGREGLDEPGLRERARTLPAARRAARRSRSYCFPYALVGWHVDRVGVDIERVVPCEPGFGDSICTPGERATGVPSTNRAIISLWSSKEALAKALGDALAYDPRQLGSPIHWPDGVSGPWRARELDAPEGYCAWVCWRAGSGG